MATLCIASKLCQAKIVSCDFLNLQGFLCLKCALFLLNNIVSVW